MEIQKIINEIKMEGNTSSVVKLDKLSNNLRILRDFCISSKIKTDRKKENMIKKLEKRRLARCDKCEEE